ncbi:MAG TPA: hypothetical protein VHJ20_02425 [Polyangia bacterium]|nr:hypothetical protein [Polyangia bacterium]
MTATTTDGPACTPNFGASGARRRWRFGWFELVVSVVFVAVAVALHWPAWTRALVFFPLSAGATSLIQLRRKTCVLRARQGVRELEDGSTVPVSDDDARASRAVARTISRDAILIGLAGAALAAFIL